MNKNSYPTMHYCKCCREWAKCTHYDNDLLGSVCEHCASDLDDSEYYLTGNGFSRPGDGLIFAHS